VVDLSRDLLVVAGLLAGYTWLIILTRRVRKLHRRLALHVCPDPQAITPISSPPDQPITVAELLDRENRLR
jgi:hypothetical protein